MAERQYYKRDELGRFAKEDRSAETKETKDKSIDQLKAEAIQMLAEQTSGATSGAIDPDSDRGIEHAKRYYEEIRHRKDDVYSISRNTGLSAKAIESIKNHIFIDEHDLEDGRGRFYPNCDMARSWQRLIDNKFDDADLMMLKHEILEMDYMKDGLTQKQAHDLANEKYNYTIAIREFNNRRK